MLADQLQDRALVRVDAGIGVWVEMREGLPPEDYGAEEELEAVPVEPPDSPAGEDLDPVDELASEATPEPTPEPTTDFDDLFEDAVADRREDAPSQAADAHCPDSDGPEAEGGMADQARAAHGFRALIAGARCGGEHQGVGHAAPLVA